MKRNSIGQRAMKSLAILFTLILTLCTVKVNVRAADQTQHGSEGIVAYHHSQPSDPKWVDYNYTGGKPAYTEAPDLGVYPQYVYCVNSTLNARDYQNWNQHFRWRWNLGANRWLLDNNKRRLTNPDIARGSEAYNDLAKVLYYGYPNNYGKLDPAPDYHETQDAVTCLIEGVTGKRNRINDAAEAADAKMPNGNLYMYLPDSDTTQYVQNTVGLAVWGEPTEEEPEEPEEPEHSPSITVSFFGRKTVDDVEYYGEGNFAFRMYLPNGTWHTAEDGTDDNGGFHTRSLPKDPYDPDRGIAFGEIRFREAGEYVFAFREILPSEGLTYRGTDTPIVEETEGMIYDETVFEVTVIVTDDGDSLSATIDGMDVTNDAYEVGTWENRTEEEQPEGSLKTTVTAEGKSGSESEAAKIMAGENGEITTDVTDKIDYENLVKGATYEVRGTLIEKETEEEVATATESKVAEDTNGTWEVTFENVTLKAGKTYVVFEEAQMTKNAEGEDVEDAEVIEHKDIEDKAQTLVVEEPTPEEPEETSEEGKLATTVTADGVKASADAPAEVNIGAEESKEIRIVDTISYKDLTAGATYRVQGTLVEVVDGKAGDVVATSEEILCVADESGSGDWEILIGESVKVEPGKTYVVFEKAVLVKDAEGKDVEDGEELTHEDVNDKAQTIVVTGDEKTEEVPAPIVPEDDSKKDQGVKGAYEEPDKTPAKTTESKTNTGNSRAIPATSTSTARSSAPKTGDVNQMALWLGLFAAAGFSALLLRKRAK